MELVHTELRKAVVKALKQLLSEKHLYQYVEIDIGFISTVAEAFYKTMGSAISPDGKTVRRSTLEDAKAICMGQTKVIWYPNSAASNGIPGFASGFNPLEFELPTINTFCSECQDRPPFNPAPESSFWARWEGHDEAFLLGYQCQQCKKQLVRFLVCREGLKLRLAGRYPLEVLPTPKVLPKSVSKYFSNAMIAHHAGQTLAGLFLLRVFIEQFWKTVPAVRELFLKQSKATGDEQGDAYQSVLPQNFKTRFPSLKEVYGNLSAAIHSADENAKLFDDSCAKIVKHFEARQLFEIAN